MSVDVHIARDPVDVHIIAAAVDVPVPDAAFDISLIDTGVDVLAGSDGAEVVLGLEGPRGPRGPAGPVVDYVHTVNDPLAEWVINHNFGRRPSVDVRTPGGMVMFANVVHVTPNQSRVLFNAPTVGSARCI